MGAVVQQCGSPSNRVFPCPCQVDTLQQQVREEALRVLRALLAVSADDLVKHRPSLKYSDDDRDLWIIVPRVCAAHKVSATELGDRREG